MTDTSPEPSVRIEELWHRVERRGGLAVTTGLVVLAAALAAGYTAPPQYTANTTLTVSPLTLDPFANTSATQTINMTTEREVLSSTEVAKRAAAQLGGSVTAATLQRASRVEAPSGSQVLQINVSAPTPQQAADYANAMASAYLKFRADGAAEVATTRIAAIDARIKQLATDNASTPQLLASLREQRASLEQVGANPGRIIGFANAPTSASSLGISVYLIAGLVGGLLVGMGTALLRDLMDHRLRFAGRFTELVGRTAVVLRGTSDLEARRWILRAIRLPLAGSRRSRPVIAAVFGFPGTDHGRLVAALAADAAAADLRVQAVLAEDFSPEQLDRKFSFSAAPGTNLVLIDASAVHSGPRQAALVDGADVAVILVGSRTRRADVRNLLANLRAAKTVPLIPVFEPVRARDKTARRQRLRSVRRKRAGASSAKTPAQPASTPAVGTAPVAAALLSGAER